MSIKQDNQPVASRWRQRLSIIAFLTIFILPIVLAAWAIQHPSWHKHASNYGELIKPMPSFNALRIVDRLGKPIPYKSMRGHWLMLYVQEGLCKHACENNLYHMRQIRLALGKNTDRVNRMLVSTARDDEAIERILQTKYQGTAHYYLTANSLAQLPKGKHPGLYLVDPLGNVMMYYPETFIAKGVYKDINRLLRISTIG